MQKISIKSFVTGRERNFFALAVNELVGFAAAVNELTSFTDDGSRDTVFPCIKKFPVLWKCSNLQKQDEFLSLIPKKHHGKWCFFVF